MSPTRTNPEQCRIDNTVFQINPGPEGAPDNLYFMSRDLAPIEQFTTSTAESTGRMITIGGELAVERVWTGGSLCAVYLDPNPSRSVAIQNTRFPQYDQCELARSLAEAILRRYR